MSDLNLNKVLVIDRSEKFRQVVSNFFSQNFPKTKVDLRDPVKECPDNTFAWQDYDLLLLNFVLGTDSNGMDLLKICKTGVNFPATILITDRGHEKLAIAAFRYGAHDYLSKEGLKVSGLKNSINRAINKHADETSRDDSQLQQGRLINRVNFFQRLDELHGEGALLLVSIDNYNEIHYTIGLIPADNAVSHLADVMADFSRSINTASIEIIRINDDTIAIIMLGAESDEIYSGFADRLCKKVALESFQHDSNTVDYKISIGITFIKESSRGARTNVTCADAALRLAMEKPGNSFIVFGGDTDNLNVVDQKLSLHIQNSIKEDRVQPFFQPIISVSEATQMIDATIYQLRTKIIDLNGQLLSHKEFMPVLKQNRLAKGLDYWVIRHVIDRLNKIKNEGKDKAGFLITLEEESLSDTGIIDWIDKLVAHFKQPDLASSIMFEFRSEHFILHEKNVLEIMMGLRDKYGISFALTNVHGLSTLTTCTQQTSFEFVKIPMYEVSDNAEKPLKINELRQLINGSKELGSLTIADKIDNADYLSMAIECGTDFVSGYLVHPPQEDIYTEDEVVM